VRVVFLGEEHVTGIETVDVGQEHHIGRMLLVQHDDLLPWGHRWRIRGQHMVALGGTAEPVTGQAALIALVGFGVSQEKVDRPIRELVRPGQSLMVIRALGVGEVVAHALHRVEVDARTAIFVLRHGGQFVSDRPGSGM
jgi:hypothetical protein